MRRRRIYLASAKLPEMIGKGDAGDLPCRGARGTLSGGQCEGAPCFSLFPKEWGGYELDMSTILTRAITLSRREYTHE